MRRLRLPLASDGAHVLGQPILWPRVRVRIGAQGKWTRPLIGLVDTGCGATQVSMAVIRALGVDEELLRAAPVQRFEGPRSGTHEPAEGEAWDGHLLELDLEFLRSPADQPGMGLVLRKAKLFAVDDVPLVLIGQHDVLERLRFGQRGCDPSRDFDLEANDGE